MKEETYYIYKSTIALENLAQQVYDEVETIFALLHQIGVDIDTIDEYERNMRLKAATPTQTIENCI